MTILVNNSATGAAFSIMSGKDRVDQRKTLLSAAQALSSSAEQEISFRPVPDNFSSAAEYYALLCHNIQCQYLSATTTTEIFYEEFLPKFELCERVAGGRGGGGPPPKFYTKSQWKRKLSGAKNVATKQFWEVRLVQAFQQKSNEDGEEAVGSKCPRAEADRRAALAQRDKYGSSQQCSARETLLKLRDSVAVFRGGVFWDGNGLAYGDARPVSDQCQVPYLLRSDLSQCLNLS